MALIRTQSKEVARQEKRKDARECPDLLASLEDGSPITRRWAARDLVACPNAAVALLDRLKREPDVSVREVILTTLTRLGDAEVIAGLIECLRSEDAALRNEAIEALQQLPLGVAPVMQGLLADPDPDVRIFAVNILETLRHPDVQSWLIEIIESDPHINVCATAVDLLSEVGSAAAVEALTGLKARFAEEPYIQFAAELALKRICAD